VNLYSSPPESSKPKEDPHSHDLFMHPKSSYRRDSNQTTKSVGSPVKAFPKQYYKQSSNISMDSSSQVEISLKSENILKHDHKPNTYPQQFCAFLDLTLFKVYPCKADSNSHNLKRCPYYHDQKKDQRRNLGTYQSEMCSFA
jgi:hypothetical protein